MVTFTVFQVYNRATNNLVLALQTEKINDEDDKADEDEDEDEDDVKPR